MNARGRRERVAYLLAGVGALLGWGALALQLVLLVGQIEAAGGTLWLALWRFLGYFTILTNLLAAVLLSNVALRFERERARSELLTATSIAMVGLVYALLLRGTWAPEGAQKLADMLLHDVAPILYVAYFLVRPRRRLRLEDALVALSFPILYVVYALARGALDGWYAYFFLDPRHLSLTQMTLNMLALAAAFLAMSLALTFFSNRRS